MLERVTFKEKLAYAAGGLPSGVMYLLVTSFLTYFYTNVVGVSIGTVGLVVLASRIFDGLSDLLAGSIIDKTKSPHGKARAWMSRMILPYGVSGILLFLVPISAPNSIKVVFIFLTYNLANTVVYTMLDISYNTLISRMTQNQSDRASLAIFRMGLGSIFQLVISALTLPLVRILGDNQQAWIIVTGVYYAFAMVMLFLSFKNTRERVETIEVKRNKGALLQEIKCLLANPYWAIVLGIWLVTGVFNTIVGVDQVYYCQYVFQNKDLSGALASAQMIAMLVVIIVFLTPLVKRFGNRNVALGGAIVGIIGQGLFLLNTGSFQMALVAAVLRGAGMGPCGGVFFAMLNDTVEYGQWKNHIRSEGLTNSAASFGSKVGVGIASAAVSGVLEMAGFNGMMEVQSASAMSAISALYIYGPLVAFIVLAVLLYFYKLDKLYPQIMAELEKRREQGIV